MNPITTFSYNFQDLSLTRENVGNAMGYENENIPEPFPALIDESLSMAERLCAIEGGYKYFDQVKFDQNQKIIKIDSIPFSVHKIIFNQLRKSENAALFLCTAGPGISNYSKRQMADGDMITGYIMDVIGSLIVESAMDKIQQELETALLCKGLHISNRFSPGYCGWDVAEQHKLFSLLPEKFCGVQLSESALMYPIKSVSGVIGIGTAIKKHNYACGLCDQDFCIYRNRKKQTTIHHS